MRLNPINMSSEENTTQKKSGIAVLVGRSNSGKSTLMNSLVGTKVAITTPKPQPTRNTIQVVVNDTRRQLVFFVWLDGCITGPHLLSRPG